LLEEAGFQETNTVIFLKWHAHPLPSLPPHRGVIRNIKPSDVPAIHKIDQRAFGELWKHSPQTLRAAYRQSSLATILQINDHPVAYQMTTFSALGAHLARLAVDPDWWRKGIAAALVAHLLQELSNRGFHQVTVNTQEDNTPSRNLYRRLGFVETRTRYPVLQYQIPQNGEAERTD
jgi:ribosomal protein S18 acetylase RimI-like enzyme